MKRQKLDQADWHVTLRGARRLLLFHDTDDFTTFYAMLGEACRSSGMGLITDCLMSNHFHLALAGSSDALSHCMRSLDWTYSRYHNERYRLSGHAFELAYYGGPVRSDFFLQRVIRYIHLNPVRAGKANHPMDYAWSGFRRMVSASAMVLDPQEKRVLATFDPDLSNARKRYTAFVEKDLYRPARVLAGRTPAWEIWQEQFSWILEHLMELEDALLPLDPERVAVYLGSRAGIPPRAMGKALGHENGRQVSEILRQVTDRLKSSPVLLDKIMSLGIL
jgi:REP element-mobilizing transposase RayT